MPSQLTCKICKIAHNRAERYTCGAKACLAEFVKRKSRNALRRRRYQAMLDLGLKRVKGSLGGTYYE